MIESGEQPSGISNAVLEQLLEIPDHEIQEIIERIGVIELGGGYKLISCPGECGDNQDICIVKGNSCEGVVIEVWGLTGSNTGPAEFKPLAGCPYHS